MVRRANGPPIRINTLRAHVWDQRCRAEARSTLSRLQREAAAFFTSPGAEMSDENRRQQREVGQEPPPLDPQEEYHRARDKHGYGIFALVFGALLFAILLSVWIVFFNSPA